MATFGLNSSYEIRPLPSDVNHRQGRPDEELRISQQAEFLWNWVVGLAELDVHDGYWLLTSVAYPDLCPLHHLLLIHELCAIYYWSLNSASLTIDLWTLHHFLLTPTSLTPYLWALHHLQLTPEIYITYSWPLNSASLTTKLWATYYWPLNPAPLILTSELCTTYS